jgi:hypothetical protein
MKHILIYGEDLDSHPWGGIIDVEKDYPTPEEVMLFDAVKRAQAAKGTPWAYSEVSYEAMQVDSYETFPFTGTIEDCVQIYAYL